MNTAVTTAALILVTATLIACKASTAPNNNGQGEMLSINVVVTGGSTVQFYNNQNVLHKCGSTSIPAAPHQCSTQVVRGYTVDIQRTLSLPDEEEARWRLSDWSGDCVFDTDANTEPRGGHCQIVTNGDTKTSYTVNVTFVQRARVRVNQVSSNNLSTRWSVAMSPQLAGGNPLTRAGTFDCNFPSMLPVCSIDAMYDMGSTITLTAGTNPPTPPTNWQGWSGGCPAAGKAPVCVLTLSGDVQVTGTWAQDFLNYD